MPTKDEDEYVCTLPEDIQRIAKEELNEDPKTREENIRIIRAWVKKNPHLHARTGKI